MRNSKTIPLAGDGRFATVQELRVKDARRLIGNLGSSSMPDLLGDKFPEAVALLGDCVQLPQGESFDDFSLKEAKAVMDAFLEVNGDFFDLLGLAVPKIQSPDSITPVSS